MSETSCLNEKFSTTRCVTREQPIFEINSGDKFDTQFCLTEEGQKQGEGGLRTLGYCKKNQPEKPLISVITVVFNGERFLEDAIQSVIKQSYDNVEYIIIDGGSSDDTLDIIRKYEHAIDYWVSEKDKGIYDAMNKGARLSSGLFVGFLNADDFFYLNTISDLAFNYIKNDFDYTFGPVDIFGEEDKYVETSIPIKDMNYTKGKYIGMPSHHQAIFIKKELFGKLNGYDLRFKIRADYDLVLRLLSISKKVWYFPSSVGAFRLGGVSGSYSTFLENFELLKKHNVGFLKRNLVTIESLLKVLVSRIIPDHCVRILRKIKPSGRYQKLN